MFDRENVDVDVNVVDVDVAVDVNVVEGDVVDVDEVEGKCRCSRCSG